MRVRMILCTLLALLYFTPAVSAFAEYMPTLPPELRLPSAEEGGQPTLSPERPLRRAVIRAAGDMMSHAHQLELALQEDGSYDYFPQYELAAPSLSAADYTIANLETTIGQVRGMPYSGFPMFNAPEEMLDALKRAGVDFLTLANNHMLDRYVEGVARTVSEVEARGFGFGGASRSQEEFDAPVIVDVNGIRIGMICCTETTNGMEFSCRKDEVAFSIRYIRNIDWVEEVARLREAGAEVVIAIPHWGEEYKRQPSAATVALARRMIAAGVDVIIGSHPHVVQPVELVTADGPDGTPRTGLVAYSLGNFCSNQSKQYADTGIILEFTLAEDQSGAIHVEDPGYVPTFCWHQPGLVKTLPALKYADAPPTGMVEWRIYRLRAVEREMRELIGDDISILTE